MAHRPAAYEPEHMRDPAAEAHRQSYDCLEAQRCRRSAIYDRLRWQILDAGLDEHLSLHHTAFVAPRKERAVVDRRGYRGNALHTGEMLQAGLTPIGLD